MGCCTQEDNLNTGYRAQGATGAGTDGATDIDLATLGADLNAGLSQTVILNLEGVNLPNLDKQSKSDTYAVLFELKKGQKQRLGHTEVINDNLNPKWVQAIECQFMFEENQKFVIELYDADDGTNLQDLSKQDFMGSYQFTLHKLITARDQSITAELVNPKRKSAGSIIISGQEKKEGWGQFSCKFTVSCEIKNDAPLFFTVARQDENKKSYKITYKSECRKNTGKGGLMWTTIMTDTDTLARSEDNCDIQLQLFKYSEQGNHKKAGICSINYAKFKEAQETGRVKVMSQDGKYSMTIMGVEIKKKESFLDYISGGCEMGLHIFVDFTLSNGNPMTPQSLHYLNPATNQYDKAMRAVGHILENYDSDQKFPLYGFGGKLKGATTASHCFALNGNIFDPEVAGIENCIRVYGNAIQNADLYGPTNFHDMLQQMNGFCDGKSMEESQYNQKYNIMLILTDGAIMDLQKTVDEVVRASDLPVSIIIIGVGGADFSTMETLDADTDPLYSSKYNKGASRDLVQFVEFNHFKNDHLALAKEVLKEVPKQLTAYFQNKKIKPNPASPEVRAAQLAQQQLNLTDNYYMSQKQEFIERSAAQGYDRNAIINLVEGHKAADTQQHQCNFALNPNHYNPLYRPDILQ